MQVLEPTRSVASATDCRARRKSHSLALEKRDGAPDIGLSVFEAGSQLGVSRRLVYQLIASGRLRSVQIGRRRIIPMSAIRELLAVSD